MADLPQKQSSKALVETRLAGKLHILSQMPGALPEQILDDYANEAYPDGSEKERDEFKRYWRDRMDHARERADREQERWRQQPQLSEGSYMMSHGRRIPRTSATKRQSPEATKPPAEDTSPQSLKTGKRRGRVPDQERRAGIRNAIAKRGNQWRDHLSEIYADLESQAVPLGDFQGMTLDLGDERSVKAWKWTDLDLAEGERRGQIIDALRKYAK